jgi:hypothetical protein
MSTFPYVIVGGVPVVDRGQIVLAAYPGKGVLSGPSSKHRSWFDRH